MKELKNRTSEVIAAVENGETVLVTKHGKPVAKIVPAGLPDDLAKLFAEGRLKWSGNEPKLPKERIKLPPGSPSAEDLVAWSRGKLDLPDD